MTPPRVACLLTDDEFRARRNGLVSAVREMVVSAVWKANGLTLELRPSPLHPVLDFIAAERECCPFLRFNLQTGPEDGPTRLTMTGPDGSREFLETLGLTK